MGLASGRTLLGVRISSSSSSGVCLCVCIIDFIVLCSPRPDELCITTDRPVLAVLLVCSKNIRSGRFAFALFLHMCVCVCVCVCEWVCVSVSVPC